MRLPINFSYSLGHVPLMGWTEHEQMMVTKVEALKSEISFDKSNI